ncbi:hypothetical protein SAMN05216302_10277 [Nitrosomonas aestuarii]|uniref:Uncharacterized protein n=1 Tax=Nitrosomonas aestuarii TaxID=52441 RepID=A0A1I4ECV2_9PROT|nr:hypothetical protein [Nitrosomonas aestuarii]SFL02810.1 hypothetical protein SAMN05216302_10277 [Nitrosomonas aestuarii]
MFRLINVSTSNYRETATKPVLVNGVWECGNFRVTDQFGDKYAVSEVADYPTEIDSISFKMCFTSSERIKANQLRATDSVIDDFWKILDDPRTSTVMLSLQSVQGAIEHTLNAIDDDPENPIDVQARKADILSGKMV